MKKDFLYKLLETPSPSGFEFNAQKMILEELKDVYDVCYKNQNYNICMGINENAKTKVLLAAHIDEIGLIIDKINNDGTIKMNRVGGIRPHMYIGQHVEVITKDSVVSGVIGYIPSLNKKDLSVSDLTLDIGASSKEEALKLVSVGDYVVHKTSYTNLNYNYLAGRALDDKLGVYIICEVLKNVKKRNSKCGVYISSTVGEETTGRGAKSVNESLDVSLFIALDVTYATDINYESDLRGDVSLGSGPVLCVGSLMNPIAHQKMIEVCNKLNMKYQIETSPARTFTDVDSVYDKNIPSYLISIPLRYMHSSVEVCKLDDLDNIILLLTEFICSLEENTSFNRFDY